MSTRQQHHMVVIRRRERPNGEKETFFGISQDAVPIIKHVVKWSSIIVGAGLLLAYGLAPDRVASFILHLAGR